MAKEEKKGTKKVTAKTTTKAATKPAAKKAPAKKTTKRVVRETRAVKKNNGIIPIIYMFLLILGVSLVFVSLTLKTANYIDTHLMVTCLGIALVILILSAFVKKISE